MNGRCMHFCFARGASCSFLHVLLSTDDMECRRALTQMTSSKRCVVPAKDGSGMQCGS